MEKERLAEISDSVDRRQSKADTDDLKANNDILDKSEIEPEDERDTTDISEEDKDEVGYDDDDDADYYDSDWAD